MNSNAYRAVFKQRASFDIDSNNNNSGVEDASQNYSAIRSSNLNGEKTKITDFFQVSRAPQKQPKLEKKDLLFLAAENVTTEGLLNSSSGRTIVTVNDMELALVSHNSKIFAIEPKCPHVGGPIHLGDIEDVPGCGPCIKCPWHSWTFSLTSGQCIAPHNRNASQNLQTFPVQANLLQGEIRIGFSEISPKAFTAIPE